MGTNRLQIGKRTVGNKRNRSGNRTPYIQRVSERNGDIQNKGYSERRFDSAKKKGRALDERIGTVYSNEFSV